VGLTNLGSESETCVGSRVRLVGFLISFEKNFYRLPFTPPLSGSPYRSFSMQQILGWGVNLTTMRINGLKSHDYHIWIERLLPVMVRGYLPDHVWQVLSEFSYFFRSFVLRSYLGHLLRNWKMWLRCCFVSWRRSIHLVFSIQCST
jgi:hypothetical protein